MPRNVSTKLRCSKCQSGNLMLCEKMVAIHQYHVKDGAFDLDNFEKKPAVASGIEAHCKGCGNVWTARRVQSIGELTTVVVEKEDLSDLL